MRHAAATGRREVQLLGQIVNHYQAPDRAGVDFSWRSSSSCTGSRGPGAHPLRQPASAPLHAPHDCRASATCRGLQAPAHAWQSGSTEILKAMRRRYSRQDCVSTARTIRASRCPARTGGSRRGRGALRGNAVADARGAVPQHVFVQYSPRPRTLAGQRYVDDVSEPEKTRRIVALQQVQRTIQAAIFEEMVGKTCQRIDRWSEPVRPEEGRLYGGAIPSSTVSAWPAHYAPSRRRARLHHPGRVTEAGPTVKGMPHLRDGHQGPDD